MDRLKYWVIPAFIAIAATVFVLFNWSDGDAKNSQNTPPAPAPISFAVETTPTHPLTQRIGVNLSSWSTWGANQYMRNVLMNPGFEGYVDGIVVIVNQSDRESFSDGKGLGQRDGHWKGATYEVRSGRSVGATGTIAKSLKEGANGLPQYFPEGDAPQLDVNDVVVLNKSGNRNPVGQWWIQSKSQPLIKIDKSSTRPGSSGKYSVVLSPNDSTAPGLDFYLDAITERAGKLLSVDGHWRLSFWARGEGDDTPLTISFQRLNGTAPFLSRNVALTNEWAEYVFDFNGDDKGEPAVLKLALWGSTPGTKIHLDDLALGPVQETNPTTAWRQDVIDMLKSLRPSYLRDWQGQLGDTFANRIADQEGRSSWTSRLFGGDGDLGFGYSLPDLLELCVQVQANPWIIIPPTFTDKDLDALGLYLGQHADKSHFSEVILEFGNESWNWLFRSGNVSLPVAFGPVADRAFERIQASAGPNINIRRVLSGQFAYPDLTSQFAQATKNIDTIAIAPYCFGVMKSGNSEPKTMEAMFKDDNDLFTAIKEVADSANKSLAIYEVNLHTTSGSASSVEREPFVAGAASGSAFAKRLIEGMFFGASPQIAFCLSQFDTDAMDVKGKIKLWGLCRDVSTTKRWRPTGLTVKMLNDVIAGSLHKVTPKQGEAPLPKEANNVTWAAFRNADRWTAAAVNANATPTSVELEFPNDGRSIPTHVQFLDAKSPIDTNEIEENVKIGKNVAVVEGRKVTYEIPAYGFCVFTSEK